MSNIFIRSARIVFLFILILSFPHIGHAQKMLGADITYQYYGDDSFLVTLNAYIFCDANSSLFNAGKLLVTPETSSAFTINLISDGGGMDITPVSKNTCTPCKSTSCTFNYGVQMYRFNAIVKLDNYTDCNFIFSWKGSERNINGKGLYVEAFLNKCIYQYSNGSHNSPYYTSPPLFLPCKNSCISWSVSANSNNYGDSLSYSLVNARSAKDTIYTYPTGYDSASPMALSTSTSTYPCVGFNLDAETGIFYFNPTKEENAVVAIKSTQWSKDKNGNYKVIGSVMRDLELSVMDCNNNMPTLSGINGSNATALEFCAGQSKCFTIHSYDSDTLTDTVAISWDKTIPGATFDTETGKQFSKGTFCWTPSNSDARSYPYNFTVTASDNNSPVTGKTQKTFTIKVNPSPEATFNAIYEKCGAMLFKSVAGKTAAVTKYDWNVNGVGNASGNPAYIKFNRPGYYNYYHTLTSTSGCKAIYADYVKVPDSFLWVELPNDTIVCSNSIINLKAKVHNGDSDVFYNWSTDSLGSFAKNNSVLSVQNLSRDTTFWVTVKDASGCINSDTIHINIVKLDFTVSADITICPGDSAEISAVGDLNNSLYGWFFNNKQISARKTILTKPTTNATYTFMAVNALGCKLEKNVTIKVSHPKYTVTGAITICKGDTTKIQITGSNRYMWSPNKNISSTTSSSPDIYADRTTTYFITITDTVSGCSKLDSVTITVDTTCVWPGDANLDKTANYLDILDIALGYSTSGTARTNPSTNWKPQLSIDWDSTLLSGVNYKHLDANGDGIINANDTSAVSINYGKTHLKDEKPQLSGNPNDPPLYFQFSKDTFYAGEEVTAELRMGNSTKPVNNTYGAALRFNYLSQFALPETYDLNLFCDAICGSSADFMTFYKDFADVGTMDAAIVRTDQENTTANGKLAEIKYTLKDSFEITKDGWIYLHFINTKVIDNKGNSINIYTKNDSALVLRKRKTVGIEQSKPIAANEIKIYPNPAYNMLYIESLKHFPQDIYMVNLLGETVRTVHNIGKTKVEVNISDLPVGIYFIKVLSQNTFSQHKIVVVK